MKKLLGILVMMLGMLGILQAQTENLCMKAPKNLTIDGKLDDWGIPLKYFDKKTAIAYAIANDEQNLYVVYRITDSLLYHKIMRTGMTLQLDTLGKKKYQIFLTFPMEVRPDKPNTGREPGQRISMKELLKEATMMELQGFRSLNGKVPTPARSGISAMAAMGPHKDLIIEIKIPLKEISANALKKFRASELAVNANIPAVKGMREEGAAKRPAEYGEQPGGGNGGGRGSMSGPPGGGGGGGRGGMKGGGQQQGAGQSIMKTEQNVYQKIRLN